MENISCATRINHHGYWQWALRIFFMKCQPRSQNWFIRHTRHNHSTDLSISRGSWVERWRRNQCGSPTADWLLLDRCFSPWSAGNKLLKYSLPCAEMLLGLFANNSYKPERKALRTDTNKSRSIAYGNDRGALLQRATQFFAQGCIRSMDEIEQFQKGNHWKWSIKFEECLVFCIVSRDIRRWKLW